MTEDVKSPKLAWSEKGEADCIIHAFYVEPKAAQIYRT